ncbi:MAG: type II toxin-antitoxin system RelE/ParE family toxin [Segetibacter sp.]
MVNEKYSIVWTKSSQQQLKHAFNYISEDSPKNAHKVIEDIYAAVNKAISNPEIYGPDKYKMNNDGSYRAFEKHRYRISYRFTNSIILVLRVRHTSRNPKSY